MRQGSEAMLFPGNSQSHMPGKCTIYVLKMRLYWQPARKDSCTKHGDEGTNEDAENGRQWMVFKYPPKKRTNPELYSYKHVERRPAVLTELYAILRPSDYKTRTVHTYYTRMPFEALVS